MYFGIENRSGIKLLVLLLLLSRSSEGAPAGAPQDTLTFLHISDTHWYTSCGYHPELVKIRTKRLLSPPPLQQFLDQVPRAVGADLLIITGDLVDFYEGETSDDHLQTTFIEPFAKMIHHTPVPTLMVLGNHDIVSYWIKDEDQTFASSQLNAQVARATWIRNLACLRDGVYYRRAFRVGKTRYHFFFLDNGYDLKNGEFIDKAQLDWLEAEMGKTNTEPVIFFMHKFLPALDYDKNERSFSASRAPVLNDSTCSAGFLRVCNQYKNIQLFLVGHTHSRRNERMPFPNGHEILQLTTGGFVNDANNWRVVKLSETEIILYVPGTEKIEFRIRND